MAYAIDDRMKAVYYGPADTFAVHQFRSDERHSGHPLNMVDRLKMTQNGH